MLTKFVTKKCQYCGKEFTTKRYRKVFCSGECRSRNFQDNHLLVTLEQWSEYQKLKGASLRVDPTGVV
jgi:hypothetical protein